jgi:hypothetical protein
MVSSSIYSSDMQTQRSICSPEFGHPCLWKVCQVSPEAPTIRRGGQLRDDSARCPRELRGLRASHGACGRQQHDAAQQGCITRDQFRILPMPDLAISTYLRVRLSRATSAVRIRPGVPWRQITDHPVPSHRSAAWIRHRG